MKNKKTLIGAIIFTVLLCIFVATTTGCTQQTIAREYGGSTTVELEPGQKLQEITWKDSNLWYLTRPMREEETAETYTFGEESEWGLWEGTVTIIEKEAE